MVENLKLEIYDQKKSNRKCFLGQRHIVTLIGFFICFFLNANKLVLSVAIIAMVKHGPKNETSKLNSSAISCPLPTNRSNLIVESNLQGEFDWSAELQGYVLGIGFLGCLITQVPAGILADIVGAKSMLIVSNFLSGVLTIISPVAARWHVYALIAVQFLRGASQGVTLPAVYKMMSNWIPKHERGTLNTLAICGLTVGAAVGGMITGWLLDIPGLGWSSAFYICGTICVAITVVTHFIYYEYPTIHPWITDEELKYISDGLETKSTQKKRPTPWRNIFTSMPAYAYFYGQFGVLWGTTYFVTNHPTFMGTVLHYTAAQNGLTSCLPLLLSTLGGVLASIFSHWVSKKELLSLNNLRTLINSICTFGFSLCMAVILVAGCDIITNNVCFALSIFSLGFSIAGIMILGMEMAPAFAGSLSGIATTIGGLASFLNPVIAGFITKHETLSEWHIVFWINLAVVGSSGLFYIFFGSAEVQPWNYSDDE